MRLIQLLLHFQNISAKFNLMASNFIYVHLEILIVYKMSYNRVPDEFMKGVFIAPHNFSDP
jgi:hypothetical protein